ncbi:MAG: acyl carrier protein [Lachnospiraceae bacterium]|nr:acyl carrier protein [Lachnospiraceae bacterium]
MEDRIIELLKSNVDELEDVDINKDTSLISSGFIESFDIINMITVFEEEFGVEISLNGLELENFNTVASMGVIIENAMKG